MLVSPQRAPHASAQPCRSCLDQARGFSRCTAARTTRPHTVDRLGPAPASLRPRASAPSPPLRLSLTRTCSTAGRLCRKQEARPRARAARSRTRASYSTAYATHPHYWDRRPNGGWAGPGRGLEQGRVGRVEQGAGHRTTRTPPPLRRPPTAGRGWGVAAGRRARRASSRPRMRWVRRLRWL